MAFENSFFRHALNTCKLMIANAIATDRAMSLPSAILETCLNVTNLDRARDFYAGPVSGAIQPHHDSSGGRCRFASDGSELLTF